MSCDLEIFIVDDEDVEFDNCHGCGRKYKLGEKAITGIESCCGSGCVRQLCKDCVKAAYELLFQYFLGVIINYE